MKLETCVQYNEKTKKTCQGLELRKLFSQMSGVSAHEKCSVLCNTRNCMAKPLLDCYGSSSKRAALFPLLFQTALFQSWFFQALQGRHMGRVFIQAPGRWSALDGSWEHGGSASSLAGSCGLPECILPNRALLVPCWSASFKQSLSTQGCITAPWMSKSNSCQKLGPTNPKRKNTSFLFVLFKCPGNFRCHQPLTLNPHLMFTEHENWRNSTSWEVYSWLMSLI